MQLIQLKCPEHLGDLLLWAHLDQQQFPVERGNRSFAFKFKTTLVFFAVKVHVRLR